MSIWSIIGEWSLFKRLSGLEKRRNAPTTNCGCRRSDNSNSNNYGALYDGYREDSYGYDDRQDERYDYQYDGEEDDIDPYDYEDFDDRYDDGDYDDYDDDY